MRNANDRQQTKNEWKNPSLVGFVGVFCCVDHTRRLKICIKAESSHVCSFVSIIHLEHNRVWRWYSPLLWFCRLKLILFDAEKRNDGRISFIVWSPPTLGLVYELPPIPSNASPRRSPCPCGFIHNAINSLPGFHKKRILSHIGLALANCYASNFRVSSEIQFEIPCTKSKVMIKAMKSGRQAPYRLTLFLFIPFAQSVRRGIYDACTIVRASSLSLLHFQLRRFIFGIIHVFLCWRVRGAMRVHSARSRKHHFSWKSSQQIGAMPYSAGCRLTFMALNAESQPSTRW